MLDSHWVLRDPAGRLTFHPRTAVTGAPDIAVDGEVVGYGVGIGRNLVDHLSAAGLLHVAVADPGGPLFAPLRDPGLDRWPADPEREAAYLAARARRLAARLGADQDPELRFEAGTRGIVADVAGDVTAVAGAVTALMVAIDKVKAALARPSSDARPTSRAV